MTALELLKFHLGILSNDLDSFYLQKLEQAKQRLKLVNGLTIDESDPFHLGLLVDEAIESTKLERGEAPRHLQIDRSFASLLSVMEEGDDV